MPEGPEHFKAAAFINKCCDGKIFTGKIIKSEVISKNPDIEFNVKKYSISSKSRGKELMLILTEIVSDRLEERILLKEKVDAIKEEESEVKVKCCRIVFQFGMSGKFEFTSLDNIHKHSHLRFFTDKKVSMVLSYVDVRRFGSWHLKHEFSANRGPDPVREYKDFRRNVLENLHTATFKKPICMALHDQKYFNGIGNYLRAEILFRSLTCSSKVSHHSSMPQDSSSMCNAKIPPFEQALAVLKDLPVEKELLKIKTVSFQVNDVLELCSLVPFEVMRLDAHYDKSESNYSIFESWLQCYYQDGMNKLVDADGRTIWFNGEAGPMAASKSKLRREKRRKEAKKRVTQRYTNKTIWSINHLKSFLNVRRRPINGSFETLIARTFAAYEDGSPVDLLLQQTKNKV